MARLVEQFRQISTNLTQSRFTKEAKGLSPESASAITTDPVHPTSHALEFFERHNLLPERRQPSSEKRRDELVIESQSHQMAVLDVARSHLHPWNTLPGTQILLAVRHRQAERSASISDLYSAAQARVVLVWVWQVEAVREAAAGEAKGPPTGEWLEIERLWKKWPQSVGN